MDESHKTLKKLRTYAQDLNDARLKNGIAIPTDDTTNVVAPKLGAATSTLTAPATPDEASVNIPEFRVADVPPISEPDPIQTELQKAISEPVTNFQNIKSVSPAPSNAKTVRVRTKKSDLKTPHHVGGGTIITDSKSDNYNLFSAIKNGITKWIQNLSPQSKKHATPTYTVTETERRRGVIQKATSKTGSIFTADNDTLKDAIRRRQQSTPLHKDAEISWSPNTEVGYALLDDGDAPIATQNITVEFKKQTTPLTVPTQKVSLSTPLPTPPVAPAAVPPPVLVEPQQEYLEYEDNSEERWATAEKIYDAPVASPEVQTVAPVAPVPMSDAQPIAPPEQANAELPKPDVTQYELTKPEAHFKVRGLGDITKINTNTLSLTVVAIIAALIIVIICLRAIVGIFTSDSFRLNTIPAEPITHASEVLDVAITDITNTSLEVALADVPDQTVITEIRLVDLEGAPIPTETVASLLGLGSSAYLTPSITNIHLVLLGPDRGVVFTVTDTVSAFGSLLTWEPEMVNDLMNSLKLSPTPQSITFTDRTIGPIDVRASIQNNTEYIVYGFIEQNSILITRNTSTFANIAGGH